MNRCEKLLKRFNEVASNLRGTSPTLDGIKKVISKFWYGADITLKDNGDGTFEISNSKGPIKGFIVKKKGKRFRFEVLEAIAEESIRDQLDKKFGPLKSEDGVLVNNDKGLAVGYSHRACCAFKKGDKIFDMDWRHEDDPKKFDTIDDEIKSKTCKMKFVERGSKTINNIEDAKLAATNFNKYVR